MPRHDPWEPISGPSQPGVLASRRVDATHPQELFWARNAAGAKALVLKWNPELDLPGTAPRIRGIAIDHGPGVLQLVLQDNASQDVFRALCEDLVETLRPIHPAAEAVEAMLLRLGRWQRLLDKGGRGILGETEIRGLFGELQFLKQELLARFGPDSVGLWTGPLGTPQDFQFGTHAVEIKSRSASGPPSVTISSTDQLWAPGASLFLFVYSIGQQPAGTGGCSLKALVEAVRIQVGSGTWRDRFEEKLLEVGYMDLPEYEVTEYTISEPMSFEVREGFPRIIPPMVPDGISSVSYRIHLDNCIPYATPVDWDSLAKA